MNGSLPGIFTVLAVAAAAHLVSRAPVWPFTLDGGGHPLGASSLAILLGLGVASLGLPADRLKTGVSFCIKKVLPVGIVRNVIPLAARVSALRLS